MADRVLRSRLVGINIPRGERVASIAIGGVLAAVGLRRRSLVGYLLAAAGGTLVARGVTGRSALYRMRALRKGIEVRRTITVQATPRDVYDLWRDLRNLPRFMEHVASVELEPRGISRWTIEENGKRLEWRAEIVEDRPGRRLRWRSLPGGDLFNEGTLDLLEAAGDRGTVVDVRIRYRPPGGLFVSGLLSGVLRTLPGIQLAEELARLRMLLETGELATGARAKDEIEAGEKIESAWGIA